MQDINHCDVFWVDDFDSNEELDDLHKYIKYYFPENFYFRVNVEKNFYNAILHLEDNFANYSCVVLDINFILGFQLEELKNENEIWQEMQEKLNGKKIRFESGEIAKFDDLKKSTKRSIESAILFRRLCKIFKDYNMLVAGAVEVESFFDDEVIFYEKIDEINSSFSDFKKNAGYYLFLYLLQRGMPQKNIAMLTGNKEQTSVELGKKFKMASLQPPEAFDRKNRSTVYS